MAAPSPVGPPSDATKSSGWTLSRYLALFVAVFVAAAGGGAFYLWNQATNDATLAALADASYSARGAASDVSDAVAQFRLSVGALATSPQTQAAFAPAAPCTLSFSGSGPFTSGHLDLIRTDGSVACSSLGPGQPGYAAAAWLAGALGAALITAPVLDSATGQPVAIVSSPIPGRGVLAEFVDLIPLGPNLAARYAGTRHMELLVITSDGQTIITRSLDPGRWAGAGLTGTPFAHTQNLADHLDVDGASRLYGQSAVAPAGWTVWAGADQGAALAAAFTLESRELAIILAGLGAMLVVRFLVYRRITEPVRQLSLRVRGTNTVEDLTSVAAKGPAEVVALAEDFGKLMTTVDRELAERLRSQHAAMVSERNYRALFDGHPQPMWLYDVQTLAFLEVNDAAVKHYGYSRDEFLTMTITDIRPPEDQARFLELAGQDLPPSDRSGPWPHRLKDGTIIQVLVASHAVTFRDREARFVMAEDLTESQRLELELNQSQARAESNAELSRAKDELVSMVSHELRTPLASLVGFAELLSTREVSAEQRKEYTGVMLQEGRRLSSLIDDFLDLRGIEGGHQPMNLAPADVAALVKRAVHVAGESVGAPIEIRVPDDLPLVMVDNDSILRVLGNLLSNARKYSPRGGAIIVGAGVAGDMVEVYVQDHGIGIPREALPELFGVFFRVDSTEGRRIKGTGLGLAVSKRIVEAHGGRVGARSEGLDQGSLVYFTVPLARDRIQSGDVLVVEDDSGFAHLLEAEMATRDLTTVWAPDAETAEHLMRNKKVRAVVLDLVLRELGGEDFLKRLRATYGPNIPVVVVTGKHLDPEESMQLQRAGVTAVLQKGPGAAEAAASLVARAVDRLPDTSTPPSTPAGSVKPELVAI